MKKNLQYIITIVILLGLNGYLLFDNYYRKKSQPLHHVTHQGPHDHDETYSALLRGRIILQSKYGSPIAIDSKSLAQDTLGNFSTLDKIINSEKVIFYFSSKHCYSCIDETIPYLERLAMQIGYDKVLILAEVADPLDIKVFSAKYKSNLTVYKIVKSTINTPAHELGFPFLFVADKSLTARYIFFIEKQLPAITQDYMDEMKLRFGVVKNNSFE